MSICTLGASAQTNTNVSLCHEDVENAPWIFTGARQGYSQLMMAEVAKQAHISIKLTPMPWKACLAAVKEGKMDGAISGSYSKERAEFAVYPMEGDSPDTTRRMYYASYAFYRHKDHPVNWDGKSLKASGLIGAQSGFSVVAQLKELGARVEDNTTSADEVLKRVAEGRYQAGVVSISEGDASLAQNPALRAALVRVNPPMVEKPYFTLFNKDFAARNDMAVRMIWTGVKMVRMNPTFKVRVAPLTRGSE
ncbi:polar amino acid transport system substrate-binding protein [Inhella inkyongensis]|uniref:Polar amino acid transport system substrate-binding protein n=1 Tax=Inhella inkyongensis TaxID=392593 RepID=A0A840S1E0_9BURK|nr:transporter substrate-binding domain-containing protein [Inhella inkyongensis]MBB5203228.1 polar amino acid transport system substrate-binding protein [Inhella inkyongensis]